MSDAFQGKKLLAVAVTMRWDGCITVHTKKAVELGASKEETPKRSALPSA